MHKHVVTSAASLFLLLLLGVALPVYAQVTAPVTPVGPATPATPGTPVGPAAPGTPAGPAAPGTPVGTATSCATPGAPGCIGNPLKVASLQALIDLLIDGIIKVGAVVLTIALIFTGFMFVAARGNPEKIQAAKTRLLWTLIGGLILLGAKAIELAIQSTVGAL